MSRCRLIIMLLRGMSHRGVHAHDCGAVRAPATTRPQYNSPPCLYGTDMYPQQRPCLSPGLIARCLDHLSHCSPSAAIYAPNSAECDKRTFGDPAPSFHGRIGHPPLICAVEARSTDLGACRASTPTPHTIPPHIPPPRADGWAHPAAASIVAFGDRQLAHLPIGYCPRYPVSTSIPPAPSRP